MESKIWNIDYGKAKTLTYFLCFSSKKAKPTIASGLRPGSWSSKTPAPSQSQDKESVNHRDDNTLGGLGDADVEDDPPTPLADSDLVCENDVSDKFLDAKSFTD